MVKWDVGIFEMIVQALYCRVRELKFLLEERGEVTEGRVDGIVVLAPCLLQFEVTDERSDIVENMLGEAKVIHWELVNFKKVRDRLTEVIDQWYEGSTSLGSIPTGWQATIPRRMPSSRLGLPMITVKNSRMLRRVSTTRISLQLKTTYL
jgi:hypothetical protein